MASALDGAAGLNYEKNKSKWVECCISNSNTTVCGACSTQILENNESALCNFCDAWFSMKCSRYSD